MRTVPQEPIQSPSPFESDPPANPPAAVFSACRSVALSDVRRSMTHSRDKVPRLPPSSGFPRPIEFHEAGSPDTWHNQQGPSIPVVQGPAPVYEGTSDHFFQALAAQSEDEAIAIMHHDRSVVNELDELDRATIHVAAGRGLLRVCYAMLGIDGFSRLNSQDGRKRTALHHAAANGHARVCELLLNLPAFSMSNATALNGRTAFHSAAEHGHADVVLCLLANGRFNSEEATDHLGLNAMQYAGREGHRNVCKVLLDYGIGANAKDSDDWSALHLAASAGHADVVSFLMGHGRFQDVNNKTSSGRTALHLAADYGHSEVCQAIMDCERFTAMHEQDENQKTCCQSSIMLGKHGIARIISKHARFKEDRGWDTFGFPVQGEMQMYANAVACYKAYMGGVPIRVMWDEAYADAVRYWDYKLLCNERVTLHCDHERAFEEAEEALESACAGVHGLCAPTLIFGLARATARLCRLPALKQMMEGAVATGIRERLLLRKTVQMPYGNFDERLVQACEKEAYNSAVECLQSHGLLTVSNSPSDKIRF